MDTELLVDDRVNEGARLLEQLARDGFDVRAAFWVKESEDGPWHLCIASPSVAGGKVGDAYRAVYASLSKISAPALSVSEIKLLPASDVVAGAAMAATDRSQTATPIKY